MTDPVSRAYALLDLAPGASPDVVRKQYKALVRRWHPDRFAGDPQGQAEASLRMRAINDAYRLLILPRAAPAPPPASSSHAPPRTRGQALSREEIERIVQALGTDGPVDFLLASLRVVGRAVWIPLTGLCAALVALRAALALVGGESGSVRADLGSLLLPVVVSLAATAWYFQMKAQRGRG